VGEPAFAPDWACEPGATILDLLDARGMTEGQLAERLQSTPADVHQMIFGSAPLTEAMAMDLQKALGGSADFWLRREAIFREREKSLQPRPDLCRIQGRTEP
jgi:HTH-type transcriptional regulator/antitoxin HigA